MDINRIKNANERYAWAKMLKCFMNQKFAQGFNPFKDVAVTKVDKMNIKQQLDIIVEEQTLRASKNKIDVYKEHFNRFVKFIDK